MALPYSVRIVSVVLTYGRNHGGGWHYYCEIGKYSDWLMENCQGDYEAPSLMVRGTGDKYDVGLTRITNKPFRFELLEDATLFRLKFA